MARAKSKSYGHAVKYYKKLAQLDAQVESYATLVSYDDFLQQLKAEHGKKRSFWDRLGRD